MAKTIPVYTLEELRTINPGAFEKIHNEWRNVVASDQAPWSDEVIDSLKAVVDACGGTLKAWSIGAYAPSSMMVSVEDEFEDGEEVFAKKDSAWMFEHILRPLGYKGHKEKGVDFPGLCPFTGYCADDDFLEAVYKELQRGYTLTEALESLADVARKHMEDDTEQAQDEESMLANWGERLYTEDGKPV